ncbi:hypothetical protein EYF80_009322 [Liparis tanakae]|uniref:Uncharacterized protein n=1 Tax=Liparis tanakae TaxID=230148 RepID=A0A4Z2IRQ4_9TELE|nr:hypothetical protein EYF80_009322 [Liparis tanakae]
MLLQGLMWHTNIQMARLLPTSPVRKTMMYTMGRRRQLDVSDTAEGEAAAVRGSKVMMMKNSGQ